MYHHVAEISHDPTITGKTLFFAFPFIFFSDFVNGGIGKGIKHAVTGAGTDDEIIGKGCDFFDVHQDDVFTLFVFKGVYDVAG